MNTSGEYGQPLTRAADHHAPVVEGTTTIRLRANGTLPQDANDTLATTTVRLVNTGVTDVTAQLRETDDYTSGPFSSLGSSVALVPGGQSTQTIYPKQKYLELTGASGTGEVKMTVISQIRYDRLAFGKGDGQYPQAVSGASIPSWSTL